MPQGLVVVNKNKLPKVAAVGTVFWCGDEGHGYVAIPPDGKLMRVDRLGITSRNNADRLVNVGLAAKKATPRKFLDLKEGRAAMA